MQLTGAEIVIRCLRKKPSSTVFGYPGGAVLNIYDELFKQEKVKHVLVRHEQGRCTPRTAIRSSHKVGVALVTSGPGVTNAVTGIATAYMDSVPMVVISGQVPTHAIGQDAFQECDTVGITRPCVKHNFLVKEVKDVALTIKKAFYLAASGRPGPVLVDIPKDVTQATTEFSYPKTVTLRSYNPVTKRPCRPDPQGRCSFCSKPSGRWSTRVEASSSSTLRQQLTRLVRLLGFPCTNTLMGLGGFPGTDPQFTGMPGMHGTYESNMAMQNCDVLIAVGAFRRPRRRNPASFFRSDRRIIHIDIDPSSISKR
jgi:acetolactate synthase-1/2/3 large subunit